MANWQPYHELYRGNGHTVVGNVQALKRCWSPQLRNRRDIIVYLPPSYTTSTRHYPVIYMHDGQNLFDQATSFIGEWEVDESMEALSQEGLEAIVVGIPNKGPQRLAEYSPFSDPRFGGGRGDQYLTFIAETLKPRIDRDFRTLRDPAATGIIGSSMGGLISLYALFHRPDIFGFAGAMSPSLWFARGAIFPYIKSYQGTPGKVYLDAGTAEGSNSWANTQSNTKFSQRYAANVREMSTLLQSKGYQPDHTLLYVEEEGAIHHESAWARRLRPALRFFLQTFQPVYQMP
jgi:predicted alpha/beta superfamily hydrolase